MTANTNENGQSRDPQKALNTLVTSISCEVFFSKLALAGIVPQSEKQVHQLIELVGRPRRINQNEADKAPSSGSPYASPLGELDTALDQNAIDGDLKQAAAHERAVVIEQAAETLLRQRDIYDALVTLITRK